MLRPYSKERENKITATPKNICTFMLKKWIVIFLHSNTLRNVNNLRNVLNGQGNRRVEFKEFNNEKPDKRVQYQTILLPFLGFGDHHFLYLSSVIFDILRGTSITET